MFINFLSTFLDSIVPVVICLLVEKGLAAVSVISLKLSI